MAQILVRDLSGDVVERLKERAAVNHRSLEAEVRQILEREARFVGRDNAQLRAMFERFQAETADRAFPDSTDLIREDRDSGH